MDLIRQALENRKNAALPTSDGRPHSAVQSLARPPDVLNRASIVEMKPKNKVVKAYFESIVAKVIDYEDREDES
jgi:hypothetical protein